MEILQSGFYNLSELGQTGDISEIIIGDAITVALYDETDVEIHIEVGSKSFLEYYSYFSCEEQSSIVCKKKIDLVGNDSQLTINSLNFSENNSILCEIIARGIGNRGKMGVKILSFAGDFGSIRVDGILKIDKNTSGNDGFLDEENIFLGETGKISGIPTLLVATNDMNASHACRMEKISDAKLFYLRSRGIGKENALQMMIEAKIKDLYRCLEMYDASCYNDVMKKILAKIK